MEVQEHKEERKRDTSRITYVTRRVREHYSWGCKQKKIGQDAEQNHYQNEIVDQTKVKNEIRVRSLPKTSKRNSKCCYKCEGGHLARNCPIKRDRTSSIGIKYDEQDLEQFLALEAPKKKRSLNEIICYNCKSNGHYANECRAKKKAEEAAKSNPFDTGYVNHITVEEVNGTF